MVNEYEEMVRDLKLLRKMMGDTKVTPDIFKPKLDMFIGQHFFTLFRFFLDSEKEMKAFHMIRVADESGVSGTGKVLEGVVFKDGTTVVRWCTETASTAVYKNFKEFKKIHIDAHPDNETEIKWFDCVVKEDEC